MPHIADPTVSPMVVDIDELAAMAAVSLGHSSWRTVAQDRVDGFAEATGDHQWIHVDPARAASGPFGATIAHGFLTLSLIPGLLGEVVEVGGAGLVVNYGLNRVRFPAPVPVGSRVRGSVELMGSEEVAGGVQTAFRVSVEVEGTQKPACVAEILFRYYRDVPTGTLQGGTAP